MTCAEHARVWLVFRCTGCEQNAISGQNELGIITQLRGDTAMKFKVALGAIFFAVMAGGGHAGPYEDAFLKCMVSHTSPADNEALIRWITVAYASGPTVQDVVTVTPGAEEQASRAMAGYVSRIFLTDCRMELADAYKYEGETAIGAAFKQLAAIAGREALAAPASARIIEGFIKHVDAAAIEEALGIKAP